jgi:predicted nuclease of predicted toxin-antitoxin system
LRLLLDAHVSGHTIGRRLRDAGHDVFALDEHRELERLDDQLVLELAAQEERILVTFDVRDFSGILQDWAIGGRSHAGCILVVGVAQNEFGVILRLLTDAFTAKAEQVEWRDLSIFLGRGSDA